MNDQRFDIERWLASEDQEQEEAAEAAFTRLFSELPRLEPGAAFVERTVAASLRTRRRHRIAVAVARVSVALVTAAASVGIAFLVAAYAGAPAVGASVAMAVRMLTWPLVLIGTSAEWWEVFTRTADGVSRVIATPTGQATLFAAELLCLLAMAALARLLQPRPAGTNSLEART